MLLYVYRLSPAPTSVQMSCSVSRSDIIVKSWEFRRNHKPPCSVYIRCRGVNGYVLAFTPVSRVRRHIGSFEAAEFTHSQVHRNCYGPRAGLPSFRGRLHSSLRRRGRPQSASNMTTWINSQFPRPDFHRQVQRHYGLQDTELSPTYRLDLHFPRKPIGEQAPADEISPPHLRGRKLPQPGPSGRRRGNYSSELSGQSEFPIGRRQTVQRAGGLPRRSSPGPAGPLTCRCRKIGAHNPLPSRRRFCVFWESAVTRKAWKNEVFLSS